MTEWTPPSLPREWLIGTAILYAILLGYSILVVESVLFGLIPAVLLGSLYVVWRVIVTVEAIADALQRLAHQHERER